MTSTTVGWPTPAPAPVETADPQVAVEHEKGSSGYRPALDGVRALAVGSVVAYHFGIGGVEGGFLGVDVFFVLSGYLITSILLKEHAKHGRISMTAFYSRRLRRLFPALALLLLVVAVATLLFASPLALSDRRHDMLGALFYYANWNFIASDQSYFAGLSGASPLRHTWSLSIEEQFYFVWPVVLLVVLHAGALRRRGRLLLGLGAATLLSAAVMALTFDESSPSRSYYGSDARAQQLLVGAALAVALFAVPRVRRALWVWTGGSAAVLLALLATFHLYRDQASYYYRGGALLVAVITALVILGVELAPTSPVAKLLSISPLTWLGKISYGVYLWHWPILLWVTLPDTASHVQDLALTVTRIALTLIVAQASYSLFERPIRSGEFRWIGRSGRRTAVAFVATAGVLAAASVATTLPDTRGDIAKQATQGSVTACPDNPQPCLRVAGPEGAPVITSVGDSTMQAFDPGLRRLAAEHEFTYVQGAAGGCSISHRLLATGVKGALHKPANFDCYEQIPGIFDELTTTWNTAVFIGTSSNEKSNAIGPGGKVLKSGSKAHVEHEEKALDAAVRRLTSKGAWLVLVHIMPRGPGVACLDNGGELSGPRCNLPVADDALAKIYNAAMDRVAAKHRDRVRVVDLTDLVCPNGVCPLKVDDLVMRYDGGHFTRDASLWIAPKLYERAKAAGVPLP